MLYPYKNSVAFEIKHNVCGRRVYAEGTVDAALFIDMVRKKKSSRVVNGALSNDDGVNYNGRKLFNMIDILESGQMS